MKPFLALVALSLAQVLTPAAAAQTITIAPQFKVGQKLTLELKKSREDSGTRPASGGSTTPIDLRVLEANARGFVVDWAPGETTLTDPAQAANPIVQAVSSSLKGLHMEVTLNPAGEFQGLRNEAEVVTRLRATVEVMVQKMAETIPQDRRAQFLQVMNQVLSPNVLLASAKREIDLYFSMYDVELEQGQAIQAKMETPNPFTSGTLQSEVRIVLQGIDRQKDEAHIVLEQRYDSSALREVLTQVLAQLAGPAPLPGTVPEGTITDTAAFTFKPSQGYMQHIQHERTIAIQQLRRVDRTEMSVVRVE